jgi:hypothetical protein
MQSILILAHPGHELRIFHWLERNQPIVSILTDGSGGDKDSRIAYSEASVATAGATLGPVFGPMSDQAWYQAILDGDPTPFWDGADRIAAGAAGAPEVTVVADAVDGYNPVHDLASVVGSAVARKLAAAGAAVVQLASAAVPGVTGKVAQELHLDAAARQRKIAAINAYLPLAEEAHRILHDDPGFIEREVLLEDGFGWPEDFHPHWEEFGKGRVDSGRYATRITYRDHVRPLALKILERN